MPRGLLAASISLPTDGSSPCDVPQLCGWFSWLGAVGRVAERVLCPFCPLPLAELLGGTGSTGLGRDLSGSTFLFAQPRGVRQHLGFSLGNTVCSRPVSQARKKKYIFLLKKKKKRKSCYFQVSSVDLLAFQGKEGCDVPHFWILEVFNSVPGVGISYPFRAPHPHLGASCGLARLCLFGPGLPCQ